ncbi:GDSL-type esterase/lipase family protein [Myxococcota bacterium]|nr:GDSL-type esterase/lipase family protein [Myxococcota bacterium]
MVALGLASVEACCAVLERTVVDLRRSMPTPQPSKEQYPQLQVPPGAHLAMVEDASKRWGLQPGSVQAVGNTQHQVNSLGLRGPELPPRPADEVRIFTLGDSSVYGDGVQEEAVFSAVAALRLQREWGCPVRQVIGAVPGYDSEQSLVRLRELGATVDPQWVVVGTIWSDIFHDRGMQRDDFVDLAYLRDPMRRLATWRVGRSVLAPWLSARKVGWIASGQDIPGPTSAGRSRVLLAAYLANLRQIEAHARDLGARVAFLALPAPVDLDAAPVPETILEYRAAMRLVARETGAPFVDGPAWLRAEGGTVGLFADQVHPNAIGHALLGHALAETLLATEPPAGCQRPG